MTGLEKIIKQIESDAEAKAMDVLGKAKEEADAVLDAARREAEEARRTILEDGEAAYSNLTAMSQSATNLEIRKEMLLFKQALIDETIKEARESLYALPLTEYFSILKKIIVRYALPKGGEVCLNAEDAKRVPKLFEQEVNDALREKGGKLTLSGETRPIDGGFVLRYGGVEENCSFKALFEEVQEHLQDRVQSVLFSGTAV